jgi:hypothetical protein
MTGGFVKGLTMAAVVLAAGVGLFAQQSWDGKISDSACGAKHESGAENVPAPPDPECTAACIRGGSKYVLVVGDKVYQITNQGQADLAKLAGQNVHVTGELAGDAITIGAIAAR